MLEKKQIMMGMLTNLINKYTEEKFNIVALKNTQIEEAAVDAIVESHNKDDFERLMENAGIPFEIVEKIESEIPGLRESLEYIAQYVESSFESVRILVSDIEYQMHSDKLEIARDFQVRCEKRLRENDIQGIKRLRDEIERSENELRSDLYTRVRKCNEIKRGEWRNNLKLLMRGGSEVKRIKSALDEMKQTLPIYFNTIWLLSNIELYLGEIENAKTTYEQATRKIQELFPFEEEQKNRMYTWTDESYWIEEPKKFCEEIRKRKEAVKRIESTELLLEMKGR